MNKFYSPIKIVSAANCEQARVSSFQNEVKQLINTHPFFIGMFKKYRVPQSAANVLHIKVQQLQDQKNAKFDDGVIFINRKLFSKFKDNMDIIHCIVHQLTHWLTSIRQDLCYFSDPQQMQAFTMGMAWQVMVGKNDMQIQSTYLPIIVKHFKNEQQAKALFNKLLSNSKKLSTILV